jgi:hypothetical protein
MKIISRAKYENLDVLHNNIPLTQSYQVQGSLILTRGMKPNDSDQWLRFEKIKITSPKLSEILTSNTKNKIKSPSKKFLQNPYMLLENDAEKIKYRNI